MLNRTAAEVLLKEAISESSVELDGKYTKPNTWGVYEITPPQGSSGVVDRGRPSPAPRP